MVSGTGERFPLVRDGNQDKGRYRSIGEDPAGGSVVEPLIFEKTQAGRRGYQLPALDVPSIDPASVLPKASVRKNLAELPEMSELDVVRHYTRLSQLNFSIDTQFYPLGSCTMKYN